MSSGGGSSSAIQALPAAQAGRSRTDLRGFVKTGASSGNKDNPGALDETRSIVHPDTAINPLTGKYEVKNRPGMSADDLAAAQRSADEINSRGQRNREAAAFVNVGNAGTKTMLGG